MIRNNYTSISFLIDSVAEQEQVNYLLECIRRVKKGKQKEIRPEDLLIDFNNQEVNEVNIASKPIVSKKSTGSKSSTHKKYEEYGTAGSSGLTHDEKANPVVTVDDDEDNELHKSEKKKKKKNKKNKKPQSKRKRSTSRSSRSSRSSSEENDESGFAVGSAGAPRKVSYLHTADLSKDMRDALRVTKLVYFVSFLFTDFTNYHE